MIPKFKLTKDQLTAFEEFQDWLLNSDTQFKTLSGYAGTGKTTLLNSFVKFARSQDIKTAVTATTNKAVKVLRDKIETGVSHFWTIHSLLNIRPVQKGTLEIFQIDKFGSEKLDGYDLVIIDEASMISCDDIDGQPSLLTLIKDACDNYPHLKVLFCGDPAQLQPINESVSQCFDFSPMVLTTIVRHDDGISNVAQIVRENSREVTKQDLLGVSDEVTGIQRKDIPELFEGWHKNPDGVRVLAWTNKRVKSWNKALRDKCMNNPVEDYVPGDRIIAKSVCFEVDKASPIDRVVMYNSEEAIVQSVKETSWSYEMHVLTENGRKEKLNVIKPDLIKDFNSKLQTLARNKEWKKYWGWKKNFHDIDFCYSLTTHKSQGSTFDTVIIDYNDVRGNRDILNRNQLLYVGITRAAKHVYII